MMVSESPRRRRMRSGQRMSGKGERRAPQIAQALEQVQGLGRERRLDRRDMAPPGGVEGVERRGLGESAGRRVNQALFVADVGASGGARIFGHAVLPELVKSARLWIYARFVFRRRIMTDRDIILDQMVTAYISKALDEGRESKSVKTARAEMDNVLKAIEEIASVTYRGATAPVE